MDEVTARLARSEATVSSLTRDTERLTGLVAVLVREVTGKTPAFRELNPDTDEIDVNPITSSAHIALLPCAPSLAKQNAPPDIAPTPTSLLTAEVTQHLDESPPTDAILEVVRYDDIPAAQYAATIDFPADEPTPLAATIAVMVRRRVCESGARTARVGVAASDGGASVRLWLDRAPADQVSESPSVTPASADEPSTAAPPRTTERGTDNRSPGAVARDLRKTQDDLLHRLATRMEQAAEDMRHLLRLRRCEDRVHATRNAPSLDLKACRQ